MTLHDFGIAVPLSVPFLSATILAEADLHFHSPMDQERLVVIGQLQMLQCLDAVPNVTCPPKSNE